MDSLRGDRHRPARRARRRAGVSWRLPDEPAASRRTRRWLVPGCVIVGALLFIGGPLVATAILDGSAPAGDIQILGFGTGGSGCTLDGVISSVALGTPVHMVGSSTPGFASGSKVIVTVSVDGSPQTDFGGEIDIDTPSDCVSDIITPHLPGHSAVLLEIESSSKPAIEGAFDVNP